MQIQSLHARQILDSRGNPTVEVVLTTANGTFSALVPSGASTGSHEAKELRDGGKAWGGKGVLKAVANVNTIIANALTKKQFSTQEELDKVLLQLDGTKDKSKLGANAILGVSMAFARAAAAENDMPLWQHISKNAKTKPRLPVPYANVVNGGKHAGTSLVWQEFMIVPQAKKFGSAVQDIAQTYHALHDVIKDRFGGAATGLGDEGGFAPPLNSAEEALQLLQQAVDAAGTKMRFAMDAAASEFYDAKKGIYKIPMARTSQQMLELYPELVKQYKIVSLEDPFHEEAFKDFSLLRKGLKAKKLGCQIVGDDLTVTNPTRIQQAIMANSCDCLLLKVNQIGTVSEAIDAWRIATKAKWNVMVSHRSGETDDAFISHLATGLGVGQAKIGAPARGERISKYNELLRISETCKTY